jgi:hypothetical protein
VYRKIYGFLDIFTREHNLCEIYWIILQLPLRSNKMRVHPEIAISSLGHQRLPRPASSAGKLYQSFTALFNRNTTKPNPSVNTDSLAFQTVKSGNLFNIYTGNSNKPPQEIQDYESRHALEKRYPKVTFEGNCNKIKIGTLVKIGPNTTLRQSGGNFIKIRGESVISKGTIISTGNRPDVINCTSTTGIELDNVTLEENSRVIGAAILMENLTVYKDVKITSSGSGKFTACRSPLHAPVTMSGSACCHLKHSTIKGAIKLSECGSLTLENGSFIKKPGLTLSGTGAIIINGGTTHGVTIKSGTIYIENSTVRSYKKRDDSKTISIVNGIEIK